MGFVWSVPVSSKENDGREQKGGGNVSYVVGSKTVFGEGLYGMFSPPLSFPPPFPCPSFPCFFEIPCVFFLWEAFLVFF